MRSPPLVPQGFDFETYIVLDDLGKLGQVYREVDHPRHQRGTILQPGSRGRVQHRRRMVAGCD